MRIVLTQSISSSRRWHYDRGDELEESEMPEGETAAAWVAAGIAKPVLRQAQDERPHKGAGDGNRGQATRTGGEQATADRPEPAAAKA